MKVKDKVWKLVKEMELMPRPINKEMCFEICNNADAITTIAAPAYKLLVVMKKVENSKKMLQNYKPKKREGPGYDSSDYKCDEWNYGNMAREKLKFIVALRELKAVLELIEEDEKEEVQEPEQKSQG